MMSSNRFVIPQLFRRWVLALLCLGLVGQPAWAASVMLVGQPSQWDSRTAKVEAFTPWQLMVNGLNRSREMDQLILFTPEYGDTTRTNPFGVEVWAKAVPGTAKQGGKVLYQVQGVTSIWDCDKQNQRSQCGNVAIPDDGVVISASGTRRQEVLATFRPGSRFEVQTSMFQNAQISVEMVDPTDKTNPKGRTYPGLRGSGQLIVYTPAYGQPTTGTNEYGFEVTVVNGRVTEANGANSPIPPEGFVVSGHGKMREWLIQNAPVGARLDWIRPFVNSADDGTGTTSSRYGTLVAAVDYQSYRLPFATVLNKVESQSERATPPSQSGTATQPLRQVLGQADQLAARGQSDAAVQTLQSAQAPLNQLLWKTYPQFPKTAVRAVWHRPVEMTQQSVGQTLDRFAKAGLNTVFLETLFHGYPLFASNTYRQYGIASNQYPGFAGKDVMTWWVTEAHKRNMKLHAWFQVFYAGNKAVEGVGPVLAKYPQWANVQKSSASLYAGGNTTPQPSTIELGHYFMDPANPEVQTFLATLLKELATDYAVDGIQLDYIRYPSSFPKDRIKYLDTTWGYTAVARRAFQHQTGVDPIDLTPADPYWEPWGQFKANQVTAFVDRAHRVVSEARQSTGRSIALSAAIFPEAEQALALKHQDWSRWLANGWLDFLAPMSLTGAVNAVQANVARVVQSHPLATQPSVVSGVFGPFNNLPPQRLMEQLEASLQAGASGYAIFDSAHLTGDMLKALGAWQLPLPIMAAPVPAPLNDRGAAAVSTSQVVLPSRSATAPPPVPKALSPARRSPSASSSSASSAQPRPRASAASAAPIPPADFLW
jgi:uncharacterized lipoprotein YddW (UPF0748 family)